ncbi:MAG: VWA domain-containing protein [Pirellulales bacterium]|nr:VWA domain-containing protein [Pirellulales bacterium]
MSLGSPKLARREQAIEAARRRLERLEIETHRIKADLARLEADYEDDVADALTRKLRRRSRADCEDRVDEAEGLSPAFDFRNATSYYADEVAEVSALGRHESSPTHPLLGVSAGKKPSEKRADRRPRVRKESMPTILLGEDSPVSSVRPSGQVDKRSPFRRKAMPLALSLAVHSAVLLLCVSATYVTLVQAEVPLLASPTFDDDFIPAPMEEVKIEPTKFKDETLGNPSALEQEFNLADFSTTEFLPTELGTGSNATGEVGTLDALPGDLGTLMSGAGKPAKKKNSVDLGVALFFGARSQGDRFVFVIDNSSSMKGGRLEMARAELLRAVQALSPKQSFYVIFVSDRTYPMFYPNAEPELVPATPANIQRLAAWAPNAMLASGKSRELIQAMDTAAALRPDAVYLLWDGDMRYSEKVRLDVMTHLTAPNQWNFVVHTIGMGVSTAESEQNLTAIAQAHRGTYRRIPVPPTR